MTTVKDDSITQNPGFIIQWIYTKLCSNEDLMAV